MCKSFKTGTDQATLTVSLRRNQLTRPRVNLRIEKKNNVGTSLRYGGHSLKHKAEGGVTHLV